MKVTLVFHGLLRGFEECIDSIEQHIFGELEKAGIPFDTVLHTYTISTRKYNNPRSGERMLDYTLPATFKERLRLTACKVEAQEMVEAALKLSDYHTHPDPWKTKYVCVDNFILSMYSRMQAFNLLRDVSKYTHVVFLRPDCRYLAPLPLTDIRALKPDQVLMPDFHLIKQCNDRFLVLHAPVADRIGFFFMELLRYSRVRQLHSEPVLAHWLFNTHPLKPVNIKWFFQRMRINGKPAPRDANFYKHYLK